jgi:hypothetical protein
MGGISRGLTPCATFTMSKILKKHDLALCSYRQTTKQSD